MSVLKPVITPRTSLTSSILFQPSAKPGDLLPNPPAVVRVGHEREVALEALDGRAVGVQLHGYGGAVAELVGVVRVEDQQAVDRRGGVLQVAPRQVRRLQVRELAGQDLLRREGAEGMLAQAYAAAVDVVAELLQLGRRQH